MTDVDFRVVRISSQQQQQVLRHGFRILINEKSLRRFLSLPAHFGKQKIEQNLTLNNELSQFESRPKSCLSELLLSDDCFTVITAK